MIFWMQISLCLFSKTMSETDPGLASISSRCYTFWTHSVVTQPADGLYELVFFASRPLCKVRAAAMLLGGCGSFGGAFCGRSGRTLDRLSGLRSGVYLMRTGMFFERTMAIGAQPSPAVISDPKLG